MMLPESLEVMFLVVDALDRLHIPYFVGGSMASALHGVARSTLDVDMIVDLREEHVSPLVELLAGKFYADTEMMRDAVQQRSSFNLIHLDTMFKVDVFVLRSRLFEKKQFERRQFLDFDPAVQHKAYVATAEDIILAKLEWYRLGGEVSDRQWRDIIGVIETRRGELDLDYLKHWADQLGVADLLEKALR